MGEFIVNGNTYKSVVEPERVMIYDVSHPENEQRGFYKKAAIGMKKEIVSFLGYKFLPEHQLHTNNFFVYPAILNFTMEFISDTEMMISFILNENGYKSFRIAIDDFCKDLIVFENPGVSQKLTTKWPCIKTVVDQNCLTLDPFYFSGDDPFEALKIYNIMNELIGVGHFRFDQKRGTPITMEVVSFFDLVSSTDITVVSHKNAFRISHVAQQSFYHEQAKSYTFFIDSQIKRSQYPAFDDYLEKAIGQDIVYDKHLCNKYQLKQLTRATNVLDRFLEI